MWARTAQIVRAILLASATIATLECRRLTSWVPHAPGSFALGITSLTDAQQHGLPARARLFGNQAEPRREFPPGPERLRITHGRDGRGGGQEPDARYGSNRLACLVVFQPCLQAPFNVGDLPVELIEVILLLAQ